MATQAEFLSNSICDDYLDDWIELVLEKHRKQIADEELIPTRNLGYDARKVVWQLCKYLRANVRCIPAEACYIVEKYLSIYHKNHKDLTPGSEEMRAAIDFIRTRSTIILSIGVSLAAKMESVRLLYTYAPFKEFFRDMSQFTFKDITAVEFEIMKSMDFKLPLWTTLDIAYALNTKMELPCFWRDTIYIILEIAEYNKIRLNHLIQKISFNRINGLQKLWQLHLAAAVVIASGLFMEHYDNDLVDDLAKKLSELVEAPQHFLKGTAEFIIQCMDNRP